MDEFFNYWLCVWMVAVSLLACLLAINKFVGERDWVRVRHGVGWEGREEGREGRIGLGTYEDF